MTDTDIGWEPRLASLVASLVDAGHLHTAEWIGAFADTPRHLFTPHVLLTTPDGYRQLSGNEPSDHDEWLSVVYSDDSLVTQDTPHAAGHNLPSGQPLRVPTSSSTMPSLMARMLVIQSGSRRNWDTVEATHRLFDDLGRPSPDKFGVVANDSTQFVWFGDDDNWHRWPLPLV